MGRSKVPMFEKKSRLLPKIEDYFRERRHEEISFSGILVVTLISSILQSSYNYNLFQLVTKIEDKVRNQALGKYLQLHSLFHHGASSGQIIGRIDRGGTSIYVFIYEILGQNFIPPIIIFFGACFI